MGRELELHLEWLHVSVNEGQGCEPNVDMNFVAIFFRGQHLANPFILIEK